MPTILTYDNICCRSLTNLLPDYIKKNGTKELLPISENNEVCRGIETFPLNYNRVNYEL